MNHDIPAVINIAVLKTSIFELQSDLLELKTQLRVLCDDQLHNNLLPCELYRMIVSLKTEFLSSIEEMKSSEESVKQLQIEINFLRQDNKTLQQDNFKTKSEIKQLRSDLATLSSEIQQLKLKTNHSNSNTNTNTNQKTNTFEYRSPIPLSKSIAVESNGPILFNIPNQSMITNYSINKKESGCRGISLAMDQVHGRNSRDNNNSPALFSFENAMKSKENETKVYNNNNDIHSFV